MKTPEEIDRLDEEIDRLELLAASYACDYRDSPNKTNGIPDSYLVYSIAYDAFLAGYQAAKDQLREAVIVLEKYRVAAEKAVTNIKNASDWVTVERGENE